MDDNLVVAIALAGALGVLWWCSMVIFRNEMKATRAESNTHMPDLLNELKELVLQPAGILPDFDDLKQDIVGMVEDVIADAMQNMQLPTAQDHIFGALSNIIQHKFTQSSPMAQAIAEQIPHIDTSGSDDHGPPSQ